MPAIFTPNKSGQVVTDEHLKKYDAIMKTPVSGSPSAQNSDASSVSKLIASIPKPKGIGNKIFIFTGKKKIIMDGSEREVEKIKTVDAGKNAPSQPEPAKIDIMKVNSAPVKTADVPIEIIGKKEEPEIKTEKPIITQTPPSSKIIMGNEEKSIPSPMAMAGKDKIEVKVEKPKDEKPKKEGKPTPRPVIVLGLIFFLILWAAAWAYIFGYFAPLGLPSFLS